MSAVDEMQRSKIMALVLMPLLLSAALLLMALPAFAMAERPEPEYRQRAREERRIAALLDEQIAKCDPWSKLQFEVNGTLFRPQANTVSWLHPVDPANLPADICTDKISLTGFFVRVPNPEFVNSISGRTEKPGRITDYRKWWYEQRLPLGFKISAAQPGALSPLEIYREDWNRLPQNRHEPVREPNFDLPAHYDAWYARVGATNYYILRKNGVDTDVFDCLNDLFHYPNAVGLICNFGGFAALGKIGISITVSLARHGDHSSPWNLPYYPEDAARLILAAHKWVAENMELSPSVERR